MDRETLVKQAVEARKNAYVPYSHFAVGAALLAQDGKVFTGCNVENAAYGPANCAERTAFFKAVSEGAQAFSAIAVVGGPKDGPLARRCAPCGVCRQVMLEFCADDFEIILSDGKGNTDTFTLEEMMPLGFRGDMLEK